MATFVNQLSFSNCSPRSIWSGRKRSLAESGVLTPYRELSLAMMMVARLTDTRLRKMRSQETGSNILQNTALV